MENPLELPPPDDPLERVMTLARDLAYGALQGLWSSRFRVQFHSVVGPLWDPPVDEYLREKWDNQPPAVHLLVSFGYLEQTERPADNQAVYLLTPKAFALLERPAVAPSIFISYKRDESSAFALLLLARLKEVGLEAFLDTMDIEPGEDWRERLHAEIRKSRYFICLLGPTTLESEIVREEIRLAWEVEGIRTIPIWHNGFDGYGDAAAQHPDFAPFLNRNAIIVTQENPKAYNNAVLDLLNFLGYTPM